MNDIKHFDIEKAKKGHDPVVLMWYKMNMPLVFWSVNRCWRKRDNKWGTPGAHTYYMLEESFNGNEQLT